MERITRLSATEQLRLIARISGKLAASMNDGSSVQIPSSRKRISDTIAEFRAMAILARQVTPSYRQSAENDVQRLNQLAHWQNQNIVVRLFALLDSVGILKYDRASQPVAGRNQRPNSSVIRLLKKLRQPFAHGTGRYDADDDGHKAAKEELEQLLKRVDASDSRPSSRRPEAVAKGEYCLAFDWVIRPMIEESRTYVEHLPNDAFRDGD
jgi:hypothetical protein